MITWILDSKFSGGGVHLSTNSYCSIEAMESSSTPPGYSGEATTSEDKSKKSPKICGVCGDRAKSYHFGGISCDSCKAFFRRSVQNDAHTNFQCPYDKRCNINMSSRKCCQYCRFQKCLEIGMEKSWVMTEEERLQLVRQRMERKAKQDGTTTTPIAATPPLPPQSAERSRFLSDTEVAIIQDILDKYRTSYELVPYDESLRASYDNRPILEIISMFTTTIKRMTHFAGSLEAFKTLSKSDQATLLRCSMIEICIIRGAYAYDPFRRCWPNINMPMYRRSPCLNVEDLQKLVSLELHQMHMKFNHDLRDMNLDEASYMLLLLIVLFSPDRPALEHVVHISNIQDSFISLLRHNMNWRFSVEATNKLFPKLLLKLPDLRQVNDAHTQTHLQLTENDIAMIQRQFGSILYGYRIEGSGVTTALSYDVASSSAAAAVATSTTPSSSSTFLAQSLSSLSSTVPRAFGVPLNSSSSSSSTDNGQQLHLFYSLCEGTSEESTQHKKKKP